MGQKRFLILVYYLVIHAVCADAAGSGAEATLVLEAPEAVPVGTNATYRCCTSVEGNEVKWAVQTPDGSYYDETSQILIEELETMWNIYLVPHPSDRHALDNIRLVVVATEDNNKTIITCNEFAESEDPFIFFPTASSSKTAKLITIGPPSAPVPFVEAHNATAVQVSWKEPFIWEGYTIDSYFITVENTSSGEVWWNETVNATFTIVYSEGIAVTCVDLVFNVSAESVLGSSKPGAVISGFPIVPGIFSDAAVNIWVTLQQNLPEVTVQFELPNACDFQTANYTISVWIAGQSSAMLKTFGPYQHSYGEGPSVERTIPRESSEQNFDVDTDYAMRINVTTHGGTSASGMHMFSTELPIVTGPAAVPIGSNATFQCVTIERDGFKVEWSVETPDKELHDGSSSMEITALEGTWNIYLIPRANDYQITLVALATEDNNNTIIRCREIDLIFTALDFSQENLTVIGPPLPPSLSVEAINGTVLQASWEKPYIFEPYTIDNYTITVENTSSRAIVINKTLNATVNDFAFVREEGIATTCVNLTTRITAASTLGISKPGMFMMGFPVAPGLFDDAAVNTEVVFKQNDLTPKVDVKFELPSACNFEMANYTMFVWENGLENETLTFGPNEHSYSNGRSVTREIPFNSSEPDLAVDTEYLMIIEVTTSAGSSTSGTISFCTEQPSREDSTGTLSVGVIVGIAVGTSIGAIFVLCLLFAVASSAVLRIKKRRVVVNVRAMVDNPIYVGDEEQYENIEGYQPTFVSGPPQIQFMAPAPYAVTGPPPILPAPRKEKVFEHLAEGCTKSADDLSQVSTGDDTYTMMNAAGPAAQTQRDDQNIYVKSEC